MKQVNIRTLRANISTYLSDLPFEITRNGVVVAVCAQPGEKPRTQGRSVHTEKSKNYSELRAKYKADHPREICPGCRYFNESCECPQ